MVDFGKETVDLEDEDTVDRIIQCSQAAAPFFSVRYNLIHPGHSWLGGVMCVPETNASIMH